MKLENDTQKSNGKYAVAFYYGYSHSPLTFILEIYIVYRRLKYVGTPQDQWRSMH